MCAYVCVASCSPGTLGRHIMERQPADVMERQPAGGIPASCLRTATVHDLLRFTRRLGEYHNAERLLQALPSALHDLVSANTFNVIHENGCHSASSLLIDSQTREALDPPHLSLRGARGAFLVGEQGPLVIPSVVRETRFPDVLEWFHSQGDRSLCVLPLRTARRRLGVICAGRSFENAFSEDEVALLSVAADHAALALDHWLNFASSERARLQLEDESTRLKFILDLNNSVVSDLDLKQMIQSISPSIRRMMQIDAVALMLPTPDGQGLEVCALDFPAGDGNIRPGAVLSWESPSGETLRTGTPWVGDVSEQPPQYFRHGPQLEGGVKALCLAPLIRRGRTIGVLAVARLGKDSFARPDVDFLLQIAGQIAIAIDNAPSHRKISEASDTIAQEKFYLEDEIRSELNFEEIVGNSAVLRRLLRQVEAVAPTDSTVLIYGETGSGKELIARAVHKLSKRSSEAFVKLNCAAIPTGLVESELFGHEKGAFTGAIAQRIGRFELASKGTIFLDEIGEIPLELQPKLLRVLQEREFERLGSSRTLHSDARLVAATNRDLNAMVEDQKFRSDLFYRLHVFPIYVPPLRERKEDIPFLVRHFAEHYGRLMKKQLDISSETMNSLVRYSWPGNIRELQNVVERAVILSSRTTLKIPLTDLRPRLANGSGEKNVMTLEEMERRHILSVLEQTGWILSGLNGAAARLGVKRPTLQFRMRKLGISRPIGL
jgi:formate hydrogenlyase transcriptional activator